MPAKKPDYYAILGLTSDAGDSEIRAAYKKLALQWHPDRHLSGKEHAAQIFIEVNTAYHVLMDGKESTHSVPPENSSATSCSNTGSTGTAPSEFTAKSTQPSSHPPSDSRKSSRTKRSPNVAGMLRNLMIACVIPKNPAAGRVHLHLLSGLPHARSTRRITARPRRIAIQTTNQKNVRVVVLIKRGRISLLYLRRRADFTSHPGLDLQSRGTKGGKDRQEFIPHVDDVPPSESPLHAMRSPRGTSKEWMFPLPVTLEEIFYGSRHRFLIKRELLSHKIEEVEICVRVPAGTRTGTRIVCRGAGHQRKDGTFQDVVFLVEDEPGQRFSRVNDDLYLDIRVPWQDSLADGGGDIYIDGLDGEEIVFPLPYPIHDNTTEGQVFVKGAGMPTLRGHRIVGRGDMIVRWQVVFAVPSKWEAFKRAFRVKP
ncbi:hypothetical protein EDD17DRAFT_1773166 [Pisolithus thermaeus]|nr:hypothetical protein EDD17DRAFT_1773166 [Pisolithus thermaeus]